jgi:hypothetical protein
MTVAHGAAGIGPLSDDMAAIVDSTITLTMQGIRPERADHGTCCTLNWMIGVCPPAPRN